MRFSLVDEKLWTIGELARFLGVTRKTLYRLVQRGRIPAFKIGWMWRFREIEIHQWLEGHRAVKVSRARDSLPRYGRPH